LQFVQPKVSVRLCGPAFSPQSARSVPPSNQSRVRSPLMASICRSSRHEVHGTTASAFVGKTGQKPAPRKEFSESSVPELVARQLRSVPRVSQFVSKSCVSKPSVSELCCSAYVAGRFCASSPKRVLARPFERIRQTAVSSRFQSMRQQFAAPRSLFEARSSFDS